MTSPHRRTSTPPTALTCPQLIFLLIFILAFFPSVLFTLLNFLTSLPSSVAHLALSHPSGAKLPESTTSSSTPSSAPHSIVTMSWFQKTINLPARSRGSYLVTDHIMSELPEIRNYKTGLLNLFIQHTSCALSLNENWDADVRADMSDALDRLVPEDWKGDLYRHSAEGTDDMPAHIKSALIGASVTIPITNGRLATGTWQGIWYLEFRTSKHHRRVVATIQGEKME
ncbi:secondary thiamine-phosphate synthase enzyme [Coccidioides immitis RS]|uniref:Secondary thiamine-phosphate synthase enzyme n=1 Tax=Coccidioides immitis (strain RS) TaxID=246410 RepID=J3K837_COCIM|nr:secondary thiamine-phosphate synthase enzyme [Coccidioides immitis RS]EAS30937.3 secondary thiamine-phosphate synthase enzyme [Coccidioides immitis RS]